MESPRTKELRQQHKKISASYGYWTLSTKKWQEKLNKYTDPKWNQYTQRQYNYCAQRAEDAKNKLDQIRAELTQIDPIGSKKRQLNNAYNSISHARKMLTRLQQIAAHRIISDPATTQTQQEIDRQYRRIDTLQQKLAALRASEGPASAGPSSPSASQPALA